MTAPLDIENAPVVANARRAIGAHPLDRLLDQLDRAGLPARTRRLVRASVDKKAKKLVEDAAELARLPESCANKLTKSHATAAPKRARKAARPVPPSIHS